MTPLDAIAARQHPDGSWHAPPDDGGLTTAVTLIALRYAGLLEEGEAQAMATALRRRVLPDGTVGAYPGAPRGSASATTLVSTALRAAGREPLAKAAPPQDLLLRVICEPGRHRRLLPTALLALPAFQRLLDDALGFSGLVGAHLLLPLLRPPVSARGRRAVVDYLVAHQDRQGSWASIGAITAVGLMALRAAGASRDDPAVGRAAAFLRASLVNRHGGRDMPPCSCAVWDTAQAVRLLASQGRDVARGVDWLLRHRCMAGPPRIGSAPVRERRDGAAGPSSPAASSTPTPTPPPPPCTPSPRPASKVPR